MVAVFLLPESFNLFVLAFGRAVVGDLLLGPESVLIDDLEEYLVLFRVCRDDPVFLGDDGYPAQSGDTQCERKSRNTAAENEKVKLFH